MAATSRNATATFGRTPFAGWLQEKLRELDALNDAWGTAFWSQHYGDWDEIYPPRRAPTFINPTSNSISGASPRSILDCFERNEQVIEGK